MRVSGEPDSDQNWRGVKASAARPTTSPPAEVMALAASASVAPVVTTSSMSTKRLPVNDTVETMDARKLSARSSAPRVF